MEVFVLIGSLGQKNVDMIWEPGFRKRKPVGMRPRDSGNGGDVILASL